MKNKFVFYASVIILFICFFSCKKDDANPVQVPDPNGTITATLDPTGVIIYSEMAEDAPYSFPDGYTFNDIRLYMFMSTTNLNASFRTDAYSIDNVYWGAGVGFQSGEFANIGTVDGLGYITTKPTSGYTLIGTIEKGHGYVIRSKKYLVDTPNAPYSYYRFYVVDWLVNTNGGINGAKIKIQGPF